MRSCNGIGLAAPQVGILKRYFVADIGDGPVKMINPEVLKTYGHNQMEEGCLSLPDVQIFVKRADGIKVHGYTENGEEREWNVEGLLARVMLHEIDHLNGKLIIDYLDFWK